MLSSRFKDFDLHLAQSPAFFKVNAQILRYLSSTGFIGQLFGFDIGVVSQDGVHHGQALERLAEVVLDGFFFAVGQGTGVHHRGGAEYFLGDGAQHVFRQVHQVVVVGIGLIKLHHGEFRIMTGGKPFITEIAVDLEYPLETTDHEALEEQFRSNTQVHVDTEGVVVGHKRARRGTARDHLQHRGFDFHEVPVSEVLAHDADNL